MVQCFAPDCNHASESHTCRFFGFPSSTKKAEYYKRWIKLLRRADRSPGKHSRVCSCHFRDGNKENGPEIFKRNADTMFAPDDYSKAKTAKKSKAKTNVLTQQQTIAEIVNDFNKSKEAELETIENKERPSVTEIVLKAELEEMRRELETYKEKAAYQRSHYSVSTLSPEVIRMETGLPTKEIFDIVVSYALRFKNSINYFSGWTVTSISFEDQVFIALMKVRQNYTNLHLAQLFSCSVATITNIEITFIYVLHEILFKDIMTTIPSRHKNSTSSPSSFSGFA